MRDSSSKQAARLIINPAAWRLPAQQELQEASTWLKAQGWSLDIVTAQSMPDLWVRAREAADLRCAAVVACGGDGTLSLIADAISGSDTALAVIPGGTSNIWAHEARIPRRPLSALQLLVTGERRRVDLGSVSGPHGERVFLLMAGVGFDAAVVRRVSPLAKQYLGPLAYVLQGLAIAPQFGSQRTRLRIDHTPHEADLLLLVIGNTRGYAGITSVTKRAHADDGLLDLCLYEGNGLHQIAQHILRTLLAVHTRHNGVRYWRVRRAEVMTPGLPIQIDGDYLGETPATFQVRPAALTVYLPRNVHLPLLRGETGRD